MRGVESGANTTSRSSRSSTRAGPQHVSTAGRTTASKMAAMLNQQLSEGNMTTSVMVGAVSNQITRLKHVCLQKIERKIDRLTVIHQSSVRYETLCFRLPFFQFRIFMLGSLVLQNPNTTPLTVYRASRHQQVKVWIPPVNTTSLCTAACA